MTHWLVRLRLSFKASVCALSNAGVSTIEGRQIVVRRAQAGGSRGGDSDEEAVKTPDRLVQLQDI